MTSSVAISPSSSVFPVVVPGFESGTPAPLDAKSMAHRRLLIVTGHGEPAVAVMNGCDGPGQDPEIIGILEGTLPAGMGTFNYDGHEAPGRYLSVVSVLPGRVVWSVNFDLYPIARLRSTAFRVPGSSNLWEWAAWESIFATQSPRERVVLYQKDVFHLSPGMNASQIHPALRVEVSESKDVSKREIVEEFLAVFRREHRDVYVMAEDLIGEFFSWKMTHAPSLEIRRTDVANIAAAVLTKRQRAMPGGCR